MHRHAASRRELAGIRRAIRRDLQDASLADLSTDGRFAQAYEAALLYAKMAIACAGYRIRGESSHETTFLALELAIGPAASPFVDYFETCRRLRNELSYERAGVVGPREVTEILERTHRLEEVVEAWIANHHPHLA